MINSRPKDLDNKYNKQILSERKIDLDRNRSSFPLPPSPKSLFTYPALTTVRVKRGVSPSLRSPALNTASYPKGVSELEVKKV